MGLSEGEGLIVAVCIGGGIVGWQVQRLLSHLKGEVKRVSRHKREADTALETHKAEDAKEFKELRKELRTQRSESRERATALHRELDRIMPLIYGLAGKFNIKVPEPRERER